MGRTKTYGIFNKGAQKVEKSAKNKVETVLRYDSRTGVAEDGLAI